MNDFQFICCDTETNAKSPRWDPEFRIVGWGTAERISGTISSEYTPIGHMVGNVPEPDKELSKLGDRLADESNIWIFHNAPFDLDVLYRYDLPMPKRWYCTQQMTHWIDENIPSLKLDYIGEYWVKERKVSDPMMNLITSKWGWPFVPVDMMAHYCRQDCELTLKVFEKIAPLFVEQFDDELRDILRAKEKVPF